MAMEIEDDVFFADLSKQIALLIMDDEEEEFPVQSPPAKFQGFHLMPQTMMPPPYLYVMADRREVISKGTGVFIPRSSSLPRKKNRSNGKSNSANNNSSQRKLDKSGVPVSHATNYSKQYSGSLKNRI